MTPTQECDLIIIGGGPAGLAAAINGASEGLNVVLMDSGPQLGGQAARSSLIENYPGFPDGISGADLLGNFVRQAGKFRTDLLCPQTAASLRIDGHRRIVTTDDEQTYVAKMVILATGLSYRRLGTPGLSGLLGRGAQYGSPTIDPLSLGDCTICIIGGANSAGQAAMDLSRNTKAKIKILVRKNLAAQMSKYLLDRIEQCPTIEVLEGTEVTEVRGTERLEAITVKNGDGTTTDMQTDHLLIFIGASPKTLWIKGTVRLDDRGFILTGRTLVTENLWDGSHGRQPLNFETSMPGVFACGDVRVSSIKRVGAAVGEGIATLANCHEYMRLNGNGNS